MKTFLIPFRERIAQKPQAWVGLLIFCACLFIYLANHRTISSGDNIPSSLLAFNWLSGNSLNFDGFRNSYLWNQADSCVNCASTPHYFVEAPSGHLTSTYPIGNAILSFPIYGILFVVLKLTHGIQSWIGQVPVALSITDAAFEVHRQAYEKLVATILTSGAVVLFYFCAALKFHPGIALLVTFIYGFATNTWMTNSQGLWQHGAANFALLSVLLCLLKANRAVNYRPQLLLVAGFFCGLIPGCRPTSILFAIAIFLYCLFTYGRDVRFFLLGLPSFILSSSWNFYYFGFSPKNLLVAGYSRFSNTSFTASFYQFTPGQFLQGCLGLLISPSRGLLVYSPILLFAIPGVFPVWKLRGKKDELLIGCLTIAAILVFFQYCFFTIWWGGWGYGPRFLTDILPVLCLLIGYGLTVGIEHLPQRWFNGAAVLFFSLLFLSTSVQVVGAFGNTLWDSVPVSSDSRLWDTQDTQIQRHANSLFYALQHPIDKPRKYLRRTDGVIQTVRAKGQPQKDGILTASPAQKMVLTARLKNRGKTQWCGYETGMIQGETRVQVEFLDPAGNPVPINSETLLYVSGNPEPKEKAKAIGTVQFPAQPGNYRMRLTPIVQGQGKFIQYKTGKRPAFELQAVVLQPSSP